MMLRELACLAMAVAATSFAWSGTRIAPPIVARYFGVPSGSNTVSFENPAQRFVARFDSAGLCVSKPRTPESNESAIEVDPTWRIALVAFGREGMMRPVMAGTPVVTGNRIEVDRGELIDLTEWYVNDARGIEQGFTIGEPPIRQGADSWLVIECELGGTVVGARTAEGLEFASVDRSFVLHYAELVATDSSGRDLPARIALDGNRLRIEVDDRDACYPIVVDPLTFSPQWTANNGGATDFGSSVSSAGDVDGDGYDDVIVGARSYSNGQSWEGAALVYRGGPVSLSLSPSWKVESNITFAFFGTEVTGAGDVNNDGYADVAVATAGYLVGSVAHARVYVYLGSAGGLSLIPASIVEIPLVAGSSYLELKGIGDVTQDGFDDLLVGVTQGSVERVHLYRGNANGIESTPLLSILPPQVNSGFGRSLDAAGDLNGDGLLDIVVGAPGYASGQINEGAAYAFLGTLGGIASAPVWHAESDVAGSLFAQAVGGGGDFDLDGFDDLVVGAPSYGTALFQEGRAFAYRGSASGPSAASVWSAHPEIASSQFGSAVAIPGDVDGDGYADVLIGSGGNSGGRMTVFLGSPTGLESVAAWTSKQASFLGQAVALAGDVNGDGFPDVIGGGSNSDSGSEIAQVYHGGPLASWAPFGAGKKPNSPNLTTEQPPLLGNFGVLRCIGGKPQGKPFLFLGTQPTALPFDLTTLYVVPILTLQFPVLDLNGQGNLTLAIPAIPTFVGLDAYFQVGLVDPGAPGPYHTRLSNGVHWWLGN